MSREAADADSVVHLGLGTNLGDRTDNLARAYQGLLQLPVHDLRPSSVFDSAPVGPDQPRYLNAALELRTGLSPRELLDRLKSLERALGRQPGVRWGPRSIDFDVLLWGERVLDEPQLTIPHPRLHERAFVLAPLAELAPDAVHPILRQTVAEMLSRVAGQDVKRVAAFPSS